MARFSLHLSFADLGLPDVGYIAIPIRLTSKNETVVASAQKHISMHIQGAHDPESLLIFAGTCGVDPVQASHSTFWLNGDYQLPLHNALAALETGDERTLRRQAEKVFKNFLDDLVIACDARINEKEKEYIRYSLLRR